jgi:hypothetical protein
VIERDREGLWDGKRDRESVTFDELFKFEGMKRTDVDGVLHIEVVVFVL